MSSRTRILSMVYKDQDIFDDDDDFQSPINPPSSSLAIHSSTTKPKSSRPLQPSNGSRSRKKSRPSTSSGKENHWIKQEMGIAEEKRDLLASRAVLGSRVEKTLDVAYETVDTFTSSEGNDIGDGKAKVLTLETHWACSQQAPCLNGGSFVLQSGETVDREEQVTEKEEQVVKEQIENDEIWPKGEPLLLPCSKVCVEPYAGSIESRLLRVGAAEFSCSETNEGEMIEDEDGDFDVSTQLNELMRVCSELNDKEKANLNGTAGSDVVIGAVECPLCGMDITSISEELRYAHTNSCLDNSNLSQATIHSTEKDSSCPGANFVEVQKFLRSLELSRFEEAFSREEIDWDTLQWLTEEDLISIGVTALGPRKKIVHKLNNIRRGRNSSCEVYSNIPKSLSQETAKISAGNRLITEYFQGSLINRGVQTSSKVPGVLDHSSDSIQKRVRARKPACFAKSKDVPPWCSIPGTNFRVDAFRFLRGDCSHWFLTHFHLDHYQGLTKNFRHGKIYCSMVTASLVNMKIGIPWERLHVLPLGEKMDIDGVKVTCLDANHCPGSIILLFEPVNGKAVLHTGDFRFNETMTECTILQSCKIHTLILDTTYCNPQYDFPKQDVVIQFVIEAIQAEAFNPKTLFLIGSYTIGKENLFLQVARCLRKKVYVGTAKLRLLHCLGFQAEDMQWFTSNEMESDIHVVPMWTIASFRRMKHISNQYSARYNLIVAFSPTGWTFGKGKKKSPGKRWQQGTIIRYEVPYSEHSSFSELQQFVQFISPDVIIPSVNNTGPQAADSMIALLSSDEYSGSTL